MKDTVLLDNGKSRFLRSVSNFLSLYPTYESMVAALVAGTLPVDFAGVNSAGCAQIGTSLNKANLLSDATAQALGLSSQDPTINEALAALAGKQGAIIASGVLQGDGQGNITAKNVDTAPASGSSDLITSGALFNAVKRTDAIDVANTDYGIAMARGIYATTTDLTAGTTSLTSGVIALVYEA